jgi:hypothetical protein|tara:strand:- start:315 stop:533 length:219 start_codon:yes stop_codon:yes gene_type:complete
MTLLVITDSKPMRWAVESRELAAGYLCSFRVRVKGGRCGFLTYFGRGFCMARPIKKCSFWSKNAGENGYEKN